MYEIVWSPDARDDLKRLPAFHRPTIVTAVEALELLATSPSRHRKPLLARLELLPEASWEVRVGTWRVLYRLDDARTVTVLRVILKGTVTTEAAVKRSRKP